ncbi:MAG: sugar transferase [Patescibacteria group bacterium]
MRKLTLFFIDIALLYASLLAMLQIRYDSNFKEEYIVHLLPFIVIFAIWILVFYIASLYEPRFLRNNVYFYSRLFETIIVVTVISTSIFYLIPFFGIAPKTNLAIFTIIFTILETLGRSSYNSIVETRLKKLTLIVGDNEQSRELATFIVENPQLGYNLKEVIDPKDAGHLAETLTTSDLDTVIISPEAYHLPDITHAFYKSLGRKINFYSLANFYERLTGKVPLGAINQVWFLENLSEGSKRTYESLKRAYDIVFGLIFGILSLLLYPFIILAMQIDSKGPIFYSHTRIGKLGKPFQLTKFRNMIPNAEAKTGAVWTEDNDPRIGPVGRFLRKTRLDEIPQFWIVVKGDMSLVGPRAERPEFYSTLKKEIPFYEERNLIKPGLSGWAQINYPYGSSIKDTAEKLKYDLYYIKNRSFLLDLGIVLKTIRTVASQAGK